MEHLYQFWYTMVDKFLIWGVDGGSLMEVLDSIAIISISDCMGGES